MCEMLSTILAQSRRETNDHRYHITAIAFRYQPSLKQGFCRISETKLKREIPQ